MNADEFLKQLSGIMDSGKHNHGCGCCNCTTPPVGTQYEQSLSRFNDTSSQTTAASQQMFAQQTAAYGAHLLKLQHDITRIAD